MPREWWAHLSLTWQIITAIFTGIGIFAAGWKPVIGSLSWWKSRRLRYYAQWFREYSDSIKEMEPNHLGFPRESIESYFKGKLPFYIKPMDVVEFMEEKHWAKKVRADCWRVN